MKNKIRIAAAGFLLGNWLLFGCTSKEQIYYLSSELTLPQLEQKMQEASDPDGFAAKAKSSLMRVELHTPQLLDDDHVQLLEVKFVQPNQFKMTTFEENEPVSAIVIDGERGYQADYSSRSVQLLEPDALELARLMAHLSNPTSKIENVFDKVTVERGLEEHGKEFYRLSCFKKGLNPVYIYIDGKTFLTNRVYSVFQLGDRKIEYDSRNLRFELSGGMRIPVETEIHSGGPIQKSKVLSYQLDVPIAATDFLPPVF